MVKKILPALPQKHIISKQCYYSKLGCQLATGWLQGKEPNIVEGKQGIDTLKNKSQE